MDEHVDFTAMKDGTREEYELLARLEKPYLALTADRVLEELKRAGETTLEGYKLPDYSMDCNRELELFVMVQI